jgi:DNA-directed RNA polymerase specialized sigma24 family protein
MGISYQEPTTENTAYMDHVVAERAALIDGDAALAGTVTISAETDDLGGFEVDNFVEEHFDLFLRHLGKLSPEDQELLLAYYVVAKSQAQPASVLDTTQTLISTRIRRALHKFTAVICSAV